MHFLRRRDAMRISTSPNPATSIYHNRRAKSKKIQKKRQKRKGKAKVKKYTQQCNKVVRVELEKSKYNDISNFNRFPKADAMRYDLPPHPTLPRHSITTRAIHPNNSNKRHAEKKKRKGKKA